MSKISKKHLKKLEKIELAKGRAELMAAWGPAVWSHIPTALVVAGFVGGLIAGLPFLGAVCAAAGVYAVCNGS